MAAAKVCIAQLINAEGEKYYTVDTDMELKAFYTAKHPPTESTILAAYDAASTGHANDTKTQLLAYLKEHLESAKGGFSSAAHPCFAIKKGVTLAALKTGANGICKNLKCTKVRLTKAASQKSADDDE